MIYLAEFCKCGSLVIDGRCSNKSCGYRAQEKTVLEKGTPLKRKAKSEKEPAKSTKTRRASKCITYNLYEDNIKEGDNP